MQPRLAAPVQSSETAARRAARLRTALRPDSRDDAQKTETSRRSPRSANATLPRVERIALHLLRDPEEARDAAQESLAKLCVAIRQFRGESQFSTWLHRLVVNTCKDVAQARFARRTEPLLEDERARATATRCARSPRPRRSASSAAASPSCRRRRRRSSRSRTRSTSPSRRSPRRRACRSGRPSATRTAAATACARGSPA